MTHEENNTHMEIIVNPNDSITKDSNLLKKKKVTRNNE